MSDNDRILLGYPLECRRRRILDVRPPESGDVGLVSYIDTATSQYGMSFIVPDSSRGRKYRLVSMLIKLPGPAVEFHNFPEHSICVIKNTDKYGMGRLILCDMKTGEILRRGAYRHRYSGAAWIDYDAENAKLYICQNSDLGLAQGQHVAVFDMNARAFDDRALTGREYARIKQDSFMRLAPGHTGDNLRRPQKRPSGPNRRPVLRDGRDGDRHFHYEHININPAHGVQIIQSVAKNTATGKTHYSVSFFYPDTETLRGFRRQPCFKQSPAGAVLKKDFYTHGLVVLQRTRQDKINGLRILDTAAMREIMPAGYTQKNYIAPGWMEFFRDKLYIPSKGSIGHKGALNTGAFVWELDMKTKQMRRYKSLRDYAADPRAGYGRITADGAAVNIPEPEKVSMPSRFQRTAPLARQNLSVQVEDSADGCADIYIDGVRQEALPKMTAAMLAPLRNMRALKIKYNVANDAQTYFAILRAADYVGESGQIVPWAIDGHGPITNVIDYNDGGDLQVKFADGQMGVLPIPMFGARFQILK